MPLDHSEATRAIYHEQHKRVAADDTAMARFIGMFSEEYFGVPAGFFASKRALDAGCGDTAKLLIALYRMGCRDVHGFDLGDDFLPGAHMSLERHGARAELKSGSVLAVPYPDASFDFTACHGVLVHLNDLAEVETAFSELARVTRRGGMLYTVYGVVGGLLEDAIFPAIREHYHRDAEFKRVVDGISPADFEHLAELVAKHEGVKVPPGLLDTDLCVTIQNVIQAPVRLRIDEAMIRRMYAESGFAEPRRLRRYVKRKNIRRFFAPLHYERDDALVKLIYGSGTLEFIARRAA